jgi:hypothetical protein
MRSMPTNVWLAYGATWAIHLSYITYLLRRFATLKRNSKRQ